MLNNPFDTANGYFPTHNCIWNKPVTTSPQSFMFPKHNGASKKSTFYDFVTSIRRRRAQRQDPANPMPPSSSHVNIPRAKSKPLLIGLHTLLPRSDDNACVLRDGTLNSLRNSSKWRCWQKRKTSFYTCNIFYFKMVKRHFLGSNRLLYKILFILSPVSQTWCI